MHPFDDRDVVREELAAPMIPMTLAEIAAVVGGEVDGDPTLTVTGPAFVDSREPSSTGGLFVAVAGERVDGHDYAAAAVEAARPRSSAAGRPASRPSWSTTRSPRSGGWPGTWSTTTRPTVVALTGSQGKTGTKDFLAHVLGGRGPTVATAGNLNNEIGVPLTVLRGDRRHGATSSSRWARAAIGHIAYLCEIAPPQVAAVLNVGTAHLGEFGSPRGDRAWPRARSSRRCRPTASPCSTPTTTWPRRWRRAPTPGC